MKKQIWRDVPGYVGDYQVSDQGSVRSRDRRNSVNSRIKGRVLKPMANRCGYLFVDLHRGTRVSKYVHRLVLLAFNGPSELHCDHLNGVKTDNRLVNLEYVSQRENTNRGHSLAGRSSPHYGVYWCKQTKKWRSEILFSGKRYNLGRFENELDAAEAYQRALSNVKRGVPPCN